MCCKSSAVYVYKLSGTTLNTEVTGVQTLFWHLGMLSYESVHLPALKMQNLQLANVSFPQHGEREEGLKSGHVVLSWVLCCQPSIKPLLCSTSPMRWILRAAPHGGHSPFTCLD